jgi:hypothetical protein
MQGVASPGLTVLVLYLSQDENLGVVHNGVEAVGDGDDRAVGELLLNRILKEKTYFLKPKFFTGQKTNSLWPLLMTYMKIMGKD